MRSRLQKSMAIRGVGGNRNTAYCHALYTYNQIVTYKRGRYGNKNCKTFYIKSPDASRTRAFN